MKSFTHEPAYFILTYSPFPFTEQLGSASAGGKMISLSQFYGFPPSPFCAVYPAPLVTALVNQCFIKTSSSSSSLSDFLVFIWSHPYVLVLSIHLFFSLTFTVVHLHSFPEKDLLSVCPFICTAFSFNVQELPSLSFQHSFQVFFNIPVRAQSSFLHIRAYFCHIHEFSHYLVTQPPHASQHLHL